MMKRNYFNIMSCIAIAIVTFFFYSCVIIDKMMIKGNYGREDRDFHAISDISKNMKVRYPSDAVWTSICFYRKHFKKSVLRPEDDFKISLLNDSVWRVESPIIYKRFSYQYMIRHGFSETGVLLISRKDASILYFSIYQPSPIRDNHAHTIEYLNKNTK